jgi:YfiH family protein
MRTPAIAPLQAREQIKALDALTASGALARGSRQQKHKSLRPSRLDSPVALPTPQREPEILVARNGVQWLQAPGLRDLSWLWHGFSTRRGGVSLAYGASALNLGYTVDDDREAVARNRRLLVEAVTEDSETSLITVKQIHSNIVVHAHKPDADHPAPGKADGLITSEPGLLLAILTADCIPVLVADRRLRVVGAFHAGWRGTVKRIVECGVGRMRLEFGSRPEDLAAVIGPGIGGCCYAVGDEVQAAFDSQFVYARELFHEVYDPDPVRLKYPMLFLNQRAPGHAPALTSLHLDLVEANRRQLVDAGVKPERIQWVGGCTNCRTDLFFSHRAEQGRTGRMMAVIGIRAPKKK